MEGITNEFDNYLIYTLSDENGPLYEEINMPNTNSGKTYIQTAIKIKSKEIKNYTLTVVYKYDQEQNQDEYQGKFFRTTVGIDTEQLKNITLINKKIAIKGLEAGQSYTQNITLINNATEKQKFMVDLESVDEEQSKDLVYDIKKDNEIIVDRTQVPNIETTILDGEINSRETLNYVMTVTNTSDKQKDMNAQLDLTSGNLTLQNIRSIEDLVQLNKDVDSGKTYKETKLTLLRDLDFNDNGSYLDANSKKYGDLNKDGKIESIKTELTTSSGFDPIGEYSKGLGFEGIFEGNNHKISNLRINTTEKHAALFEYANNTTIRNLTLTGEISSNSKYELASLVVILTGDNRITNFNNYVRINGVNSSQGIVDWLKKGHLVIDNCNNYGEVTGTTGGTAGILGSVDDGEAIISNTKNYGNITSDATHVAGITRYVGKNGVLKINNSTNEGTLRRKNSNWGVTGGLVSNAWGNVYVNNSTNNGTITVTTGDIGGIVAVSRKYVEIHDSINNGTIQNDNNGYVGGVLGAVADTSDNSYSIVDNCINKGQVISSGYTGGVVGRNYKTIKIINSLNEGEIYSRSNTGWPNVGGILSFAAENTDTLVDSSKNLGYIHGGYNAGGILAQAISAKVDIINSFNASKIESTVAGGIIGSFFSGDGNVDSQGKILNVYNAGEIYGDDKLVGGIVGQQHKENYNILTISNAFNYGKITSKSKNIDSMLIHCTGNIKTFNMNNSYYLINNNIKGTNCLTTDPSVAKTAQEFASTEFALKLNDNINSLPNSYIYRNWKQNGDYPTFSD